MQGHWSLSASELQKAKHLFLFLITLSWLLGVRLLGRVYVGRDHFFAVTTIGKTLTWTEAQKKLKSGDQSVVE